MSTDIDFEKEVAEQMDVIVHESETLLRTIVSEDRAPSFAESNFARVRLGWDDAKFQSELRRMRRVMREQAIAGDAATRKATKAEATRCANLVKSEGPKLDEEINKLQAKRKKLDDAARLSAKRQAEQEAAVGNLRTVDAMPEPYRAEYNARKRTVKASLARPKDLDGEIQYLRLVLDPPGDLREQSEWVKVHCGLKCVDVVEGQSGHGTMYKINTKYSEVRADAQKRLQELEAKRGPVAAEYEQQMDKLNAMLDYYVK